MYVKADYTLLVKDGVKLHFHYIDNFWWGERAQAGGYFRLLHSLMSFIFSYPLFFPDTFSDYCVMQTKQDCFQKATQDLCHLLV